MIKKYKANTNVSINVVLKSKKNLHISFVPLSNGNSTFTTDNKEVMEAIESHYNFGKLFKLQDVIYDSENTFTETEIKPSIQPAKIISAKKRVKVADIASAKDYLADVCGVSRTILRTEKSILERAAICGIEFYGMDDE